MNLVGEIAWEPDEDFQLSALGFLTNVCGLWTTAYTGPGTRGDPRRGQAPTPRSPTSPASHHSGSITSATIRRTCSCDTPANDAIRRSPHPSDRSIRLILPPNSFDLIENGSSKLDGKL
jgi:hypothetical protein